MKFALSTLLLAAPLVLSQQPQDVEPTSCSRYSLPHEREVIYHGDHVCDRVEYTKFRTSLRRHRTHKTLKGESRHNFVPNQRTVVCPLDVENLVNDQQVQGFDSMWIVENTSSEPVVLSFVQEGIEYSAMNPTITPPQDDPDAFLKPNEWRAVVAWEGHVFHARTFDPEMGTLGPVVLQHRLGLIPVGTRAQDLICPPDDPEPLIQAEPKPKRHPDFDRTPPKLDKRCNTIEMGFRNMANCPLHGYFIHNSGGTCQEKFKFHLGVNSHPDDFMWSWDSPTKFESTFTGHSFAFRSAADPSILVETVTLQPTRIVDCPELKQKAQINTATQLGISEEVFLPVLLGGETSKQEQLEEELLQLDRRIVASIFNDSQAYASVNNSVQSMNATIAGNHSRIGHHRETARFLVAGARSY